MPICTDYWAFVRGAIILLYVLTLGRFRGRVKHLDDQGGYVSLFSPSARSAWDVRRPLEWLDRVV